MRYPVAQTIRNASIKIFTRAVSMLFKTIAALYHNSEPVAVLQNGFHLYHWFSNLETQIRIPPFGFRKFGTLVRHEWQLYFQIWLYRHFKVTVNPSVNYFVKKVFFKSNQYENLNEYWQG